MKHDNKQAADYREKDSHWQGKLGLESSHFFAIKHHNEWLSEAANGRQTVF